MNNNKISVVINTYNASKFLARVLDSVKDFDEIVICDMESTDDTLEIAQRYGCKIVTFKKEGVSIVEPARQFAIDADEGGKAIELLLAVYKSAETGERIEL